MKFTLLTDPINALMTCLIIAQGLAALGFIGWIWRQSRKARSFHQKWSPPPNHLRDRSGFITPELLQVITGIALIIALGLTMAAGFADDLRW